MIDSAVKTEEHLLGAWSELERYSVRMVARAVQQLGVFRNAGEERRSADLMAEASVAPVHRELWAAVLDLLVGAGFLRRDGDLLYATTAVDGLPGLDPVGEAEWLARAFPEVANQVRLVGACLTQYPALLRGETKPVPLLFPGSSTEMVEGVYRGDPVSGRLNALVAAAVAECADGRPVRVLEVGAGTGGTTAEVLTALAPLGDQVRYTFTDISLGFLRHGRLRFGTDRPGMEFRRLDIEAEPGEQRFEPGAYDVVVAANVLHATRDLAGCLRHVAQLLRPGGRLALRETTSPLAFATVTFGLLDGWWRAEDRELRIPGSPLADVPTWRRLLEGVGFRGIEVLAPVRTGAHLLGQHVIVGELTR